MPYKNLKDKYAWNARDRQANPQKYHRWCKASDERFAAKRDRRCACGCGAFIAGRYSRFINGHQPRGFTLGRVLQPAATVKPTRSDLAWAAGFLEGEGSFVSANRSCEVKAEQVNREPLDRLFSLFGGAIASRPARGNRRAIYSWRASGARARGIAMTLWHFLSSRRRIQAESLLRGSFPAKVFAGAAGRV